MNGFFFFLPCRARHDSSDGRSRLHTIRTQLRSRSWGRHKQKHKHKPTPKQKTPKQKQPKTKKHKADEWLDFLQGQRQFWPTMTTRHASLAPIRRLTFQRERRLMQSKHLWDTLCIDCGTSCTGKLYSSKPTGHSRQNLWTHLFV